MAKSAKSAVTPLLVMIVALIPDAKFARRFPPPWSVAEREAEEDWGR